MKEIADNWQMEITEISWAFEQVLKDIPTPAFNMKSMPETWSPGEIIDHICKVNASYFPIFDAIIQRNYSRPLLGYLPFFGRKTGELILKSMVNPKKVKTFPRWEPRNSLIDPFISDEFFSQQHQLSAYIQKLDPYLENNIMIASPINKLVVYQLDQAIAIILAHEKRHLEQLRNTLRN
jgi:hypothetical protein